MPELVYRCEGFTIGADHHLMNDESFSVLPAGLVHYPGVVRVCEKGSADPLDAFVFELGPNRSFCNEPGMISALWAEDVSDEAFLEGCSMTIHQKNLRTPKK